MTNSGTALLASSVSAVVAMVVVGLQHSLERRRQQRAERAERLGAFATRMDRELVRLANEARAKQWSRADWREARAELSEAVSTYQALARKKLGAERL
ncbi:hypothetical protein JNW88_24570 [Micromonospora sp. ATA32]|nr:hypothetical protein [Micromonospora sp. ATA32]